MGHMRMMDGNLMIMPMIVWSVMMVTMRTVFAIVLAVWDDEYEDDDGDADEYADAGNDDDDDDGEVEDGDAYADDDDYEEDESCYCGRDDDDSVLYHHPTNRVRHDMLAIT